MDDIIRGPDRGSATSQLIQVQQCLHDMLITHGFNSVFIHEVVIQPDTPRVSGLKALGDHELTGNIVHC